MGLETGDVPTYARKLAPEILIILNVLVYAQQLVNLPRFFFNFFFHKIKLKNSS